ncbi:MAG: hypothetical protein WCO43_01500 [Chitinophagia bacterium]
MKFYFTLILIFQLLYANGQSNSLQINPIISLPKDSIESKSLTNSINNFLEALSKPKEENKFVFEKEKLETYIQLDEMNDIEKSEKFNDKYFYKPYLTNVVKLYNADYLIQISFIGINSKEAFLRASFDFIAHKINNGFSFSSTLLRNTKNWKVEKVGDNVFHYQNNINMHNVKEFSSLTSLFDRKLKLSHKITEYYLCENNFEVGNLIGVAYKSDYNGIAEGTWSASLENKKLVFSGNNNATFNDFDPHDLFHDRLSLVIDRDKVNRPVDEGCAYLYGGSWGFTWEEIFKIFKEQVAINKSTNWVQVKEVPVTFKTGKFSNNADYIVNALLIKKIEKEKGFSGVWELLTVGPVETGNQKYYQTLKKLTGISKDNYNEKVWELIFSEK